MSKNKKQYESEDDFDFEEQTKDDFVNSLTINDYINNKKTHDILIEIAEQPYLESKVATKVQSAGKKSASTPSSSEGQ